MSSSDKKFQDMLKQWFKSNTKAPSSTAGVPKYKTDFVVKPDILQEISPPNIPAVRLKALKDLVEIVEKKRLEENATEVLWSCVDDLIRPPAPAEHRHQVLEFLRHLIIGQRERIQTPMRLRIFTLVKNSKEMEDLHWMIEILKALTDNGRTLNDFEDQIPGFVLATLPNAEKAGCANEFLPFVLNIVKTNSGYLSDPFTVSLIRALCRLCYTTKSTTEVANTLEVLDAMVRYSLLRIESLQTVVPTLCRIVNIEKHCSVAWRIMKNIVGTSVGTTAIYTMIRYCEKLHSDPALLRGAIFFLSLSLWGGNGMQVSKLQQSPVLVLPAFRKALNARHPIVTFESLHAVYRLIDVQKGEILSLVWNSVFQLLEAVSKLESNVHINALYHSVLSSIEALIATEQFNGDLDAFYSLIQQCSAHRPEGSVMKLIDYKKEFLNPIYPNWIEQMELFVKAFYANERRPGIQTRAIEVIGAVIDLHRKTFGDELIEDVFIPHLSQISDQQHVRVRKAVAHLIVEACLNSNCKHFESLLSILRKIMSLPFESQPLSDGKEIANEDFADVLEAVEGLIKIFKKKIYEVPSQHARLAYRLLLEHIQMHLSYPIVCESATNARYMIFDTFLQLRADSLYRIGLVRQQKYSPYLLVDHKFGEDANVGENAVIRDVPRVSPLPSHPSNVTYVSLTDTCFAVIRGIMNEREWKILDLLLREIPNILSNKSLILSKNTNNIGEVCAKICQLVPASANITFATIRNAPPDFNRNKFLSLLFPILACFTSYHLQLDSSVQQRLIKTLERGVCNVLCSKVCITALALCTLEMQDSMHKLIPNILFTVSKVSATVAVAEPMLVFLSTLVRLPKVYSDFQVEQFMAVFAIAVQFTNPFKFNHYIVSLAYYVIGIWFLRLKPNFVKNCIKYITAGLKLNIDTLLEQQGKRTADLNEDSALRRRSASLTDRVGRKRYEGLRPEEIDDSVMQYHMEMTETCMDLLGRYAFATYSAKPKRTGVTEKIFRNGESRSWIMGSTLVTMTTSPCTHVASKHDLCEKCWVTCRFEAKDSTPSMAETSDIAGSPGRSVDRRRRHKTEQARRSSHEAFLERDEKKISRDDFYTQKSTKSDHELHKISFGVGDENDGASEDEPAKRCICWCQDWAEIHVRRPAGDTAWVMRIENDCFSSGNKSPLDGNITSIFLPELATKASTRVPDDLFDELMALQSQFYPITVVKDVVEPESLSKQTSLEKNGERIDDEDLKMRRQSSAKDRKLCEVIPEEQLGSSVGKDPSPLDVLPLSTLPQEPTGMERRERHLDDPLSFDSDFGGVPMRGRTQTLPSNMMGIRRNTPPIFEKKADVVVEPKDTKEAVKSGSNTNFLFLQLYYFRALDSGEEIDPPMLVGKDRTDIELSIRNLDKTPCYETHKIGVLYIGPGQAKEETEILSNKYGSARYQEFLRGLGTLIRLKNADAASTFLGGLDTSGNDGEFAYSWNDGIVQVIYHVATLMPNKANDPKCNDKKRHIGNNFVTIVYNNSGEEYDISTIRCQFTHACVVIEPLEMSTNYVFIKARPEVSELQYYAQEKTLISDANLALFCRQLAVHANIVSKVVSSRNAPTAQALMDPYGSNWLHRLRQIKKIRSKLTDSKQPQPSEAEEKVAKLSKKFKVKDFTEFV